MNGILVNQSAPHSSWLTQWASSSSVCFGRCFVQPNFFNKLLRVRAMFWSYSGASVCASGPSPAREIIFRGSVHRSIQMTHRFISGSSLKFNWHFFFFRRTKPKLHIEAMPIAQCAPKSHQIASRTINWPYNLIHANQLAPRECTTVSW